MGVQRAWLSKLTSHARMLHLVIRLNQRHGEKRTLWMTPANPQPNEPLPPLSFLSSNGRINS